MMSKISLKQQLNRKLMKAMAKTQKGVVLFFALIALVAMSLAAAALIRSVDTSVIVAGNLAFKQSATTIGDSGMVAAMDWLRANPTLLEANSAANGYYATSTTGIALTAAAGATWPNGGAWTDATSRLATGSGFPTATPGFDPVTGNTVRYVVERMCRNTGTPTIANCMMGSGEPLGQTQGNLEEQNLGANLLPASSPVYRVTARVAGPKNTISYIQAYVY